MSDQSRLWLAKNARTQIFSFKKSFRLQQWELTQLKQFNKFYLLTVKLKEELNPKPSRNNLQKKSLRKRKRKMERGIKLLKKQEQRKKEKKLKPKLLKKQQRKMKGEREKRRNEE